MERHKELILKVVVNKEGEGISPVSYEGMKYLYEKCSSLLDVRDGKREGTIIESSFEYKEDGFYYRNGIIIKNGFICRIDPYYDRGVDRTHPDLVKLAEEYEEKLSVILMPNDVYWRLDSSSDGEYIIEEMTISKIHHP